MLDAGSTIGNYEIVGPLGAGGMGEVYRARDTRLGRTVAIKILPTMFAGDPDRMARFEREARTLASLNHPHIAQIYGFEKGSASEPPLLVMELVEGEDLNQRLARGALPLDEALPCARQIADALDAAHEQGIIHRDLKPANIKLRKDGTVKVLDFGIAKSLDSAGPPLADAPTIKSPALTVEGAILGTAAYMSPEQAQGKPLDRRTDIWSFGCVLYELLSGTRAFDAEDVAATIAAVITRAPDFDALPAATPPSIRKLIQRCLEKDRKRRLADAGDARLEIEDAISGAPEARVEMASLVLPSRGVTRRQLAAAVFVTAAVCAGIGALVGRRLAPASPVPVMRYSVTPPVGEQFGLAVRALSVSPDGAQLVFTGFGGLYVRTLSDLAPRVINRPTGMKSAFNNPTFSPDGRSIAFWQGSDQTLRVMPVEGGESELLGPAMGRPGAVPYSGMSWSRDGILVAHGNGIVRYAAPGASPDVLIALKDGEVAIAPEALADNEHILFTLFSDVSSRLVNGQIVVQSLKTGARKVLIPRGSNATYVRPGYLVYAVDGVLFAVAFDAQRLELTSSPIVVVEGVRRGLMANAAVQFAISDNGTLVYMPGPLNVLGFGLDLAVFEGKGASAALKLPDSVYESPRVSPDGKQVAFVSDDGNDANIWIYNMSGTAAPRRLTFGGSNRFPVWSPDGQRLAFQSTREGDQAIYWQPADGSGTAERVTRPGAGTVHVPESWSRDGAHLLFAQLVSSARDVRRFTLWTVAAADKRLARFSNVSSFTPPNATFSPDGRWVAYGAAADDRALSSVYVEPFPPTGAVHQISGDGNGYHPVWSREGELFYAPTPGQLNVTRVTLRPAFTFSRPVAISRAGRQGPPNSVRNYDILPDGRFVGLISRDDNASGATPPAQIHVVVNWIEELKARVQP